MIRVTGGRLRGRSVPSPAGKVDIRPTTALVRESMFSMLQVRFNEDWTALRFLDLFSGSGIMGIEAVSRGMGSVLAIEQSAGQVRHIRAQYERLEISTQARIVSRDALALIQSPNRHEGFDVIFADPPYGQWAPQTLAEAILANGWLRQPGIIFIEHGRREQPPEDFESRLYGDTALSWRWLDS